VTDPILHVGDVPAGIEEVVGNRVPQDVGMAALPRNAYGGGAAVKSP
jgi:hypothetical protein